MPLLGIQSATLWACALTWNQLGVLLVHGSNSIIGRGQLIVITVLVLYCIHEKCILDLVSVYTLQPQALVIKSFCYVVLLHILFLDPLLGLPLIREFSIVLASGCSLIVFETLIVVSSSTSPTSKSHSCRSHDHFLPSTDSMLTTIPCSF